MAFINRDQTFFDQPATAWLGQSTNIVSIPNIINCITINGGDMTGGIVTPTSVNTLSNKSLVAGSTYIIDTIDPTKRIAFDASAVTAGSTVLFDMVGSGTIAFPNPAGGTTTLIDSASDITITGDWTFVQPVTTLFGQVQLYVSAATSFTPDGATDYTFATLGAPTIVPPNGIFIPTAPPTTHVSWSAINNIPGMISQGTFNWKYRPNYAGVPAASTRIITQQNGPQTCLLILNHLASGALNFIMGNTISVPVISGSFFTWNGASVPSCVLGTEYDFELSYDITVSIARLFINGTLVGTLNGVPFTRNIAGSSLYVGAIDPTAVGANNFYIREIYAVVGVLHTANFVPAPPSAVSMSVGSLKVTGVMPSTSPISGALTVVGGIGTSGALSSEQVSIWSPDQLTGHLDINVANITGDTTFSRATGTTRDFIFTGDAAGGGVTIQSTEPQTGSSGALVVAGGIYSSDRVGCGSMVIGNPALFDPIFRATYSTSINAEIAFNPTGTPVGGAVIVNGKLDLTGGGGARYVTYVAGNGAFQQTGAIHLYYTPMYAGTPPVAQYIVDFSIAGTNTNQLTLHHTSMDGRIYCFIGHPGGFVTFGTSAAWVPVAGTEYEIEVDLDLIVGNVHIFVNGVRHGASIVTSLAHDHSAYVMSVGRSTLYGPTDTNFLIRDLTVFSRILHTTSYTPYVTTNAITTTNPISVGNVTAGTVTNTGLSIWSPDKTTGHFDINVANITGDVTFMPMIGSTRNLLLSGETTTTLQTNLASSINLSEALFAASYNVSFNAEMATAPIATSVGGPLITNKMLDLRSSIAPKYLTYEARPNIPLTVARSITIRCRYIPNYGPAAPLTTQDIISGTGSGSANFMSLRHSVANNLEFELISVNSVPIFTLSIPWTPTAGTEHEIEFSYNANGFGGSGYLIIDGTTITSTTFNNFHTGKTIICIGADCRNLAGPGWPNFMLHDLVIFPGIKHSAPYTVAAYDIRSIDTQGIITTTGVSASGRISAQGISSFATPIVDTDVIRFADLSSQTTLVDRMPVVRSISTSDNFSSASVLASYSSMLYLDSGFLTTYTAIGAPVITNEKLDLTGGGKALYYNAATNLVGMTTAGTIRCNYTPNYGPAPPASNQFIFSTSSGLGSSANLISVVHTTGNQLVIYVNDAAGVSLFGSPCAWTPIAGTEYELEVNFSTGGALSQVLVNGQSIGLGGMAPEGARTDSLDVFYVGDNRVAPVAQANFSIRDLVIYPFVLHDVPYNASTYTTLGLNSKSVINAESINSSGPISCSTAPSNPQNVIRLSEFITITPLTLIASGPCANTNVVVKFMKIGSFVTFLVEAGSNTFTANGAGGGLIIGPVSAPYVPTNSVSTGIEFFSVSSGPVMGYMTITTGATINMSPVTGSFTTVFGSLFGPIEYSTLSYFV